MIPTVKTKEEGGVETTSTTIAAVSFTGDASSKRGSGFWTALRIWSTAYRMEVLIFALSFGVLAAMSSERFFRQSEAPHFVYQAKAWLDGRLDVDSRVLPNGEDWACVRMVNGVHSRCTAPALASDRWYVSFPSFPALLMLPFVALYGTQLNDTSFGVVVGALAVVFFYSLLRLLSREHESDRRRPQNTVLALFLGFGTLFFYCAIRGEVWFFAEVLGVALTSLYIRNSVRARRAMLAGLFFSMAVLTRTPLILSGIFFLMEVLCPEPENRLQQLRELPKRLGFVARKLARFAVGAAPLAILGGAYNYYRFGKVTEFGHSFLFNNRVNADIDRYGLFSFHYLSRNLEAAFLKWPSISFHPFHLDYDPAGLSLLLTLPILLFLFVPKERPRLHLPLWITLVLCAVPGFLYQNTGYMQFGFRFSLDYTPYVVLLFALGGWSLRQGWVSATMALSVLVNLWGAAAFRGYTELVRNWR